MPEKQIQKLEHAQSGVWRLALSESTNVGMGLSAGYALLLGKRFNIEFGEGMWAGWRLKYALYDCHVCLNIRDEGSRFFFLPDNLSISFSFII